jgi:choline-sulfatase
MRGEGRPPKYFCVPPSPRSRCARSALSRGERGIARLAFVTMIALVTCGVLSTELSAAEKPNVLFIAIDDLNDWVGCLGGHPQVKTPEMDKLAARGTLFTNAHCQAPLCNPSRVSLMTGLRPGSTGVYGLRPGVREIAALKDAITLPQHFAQNGYSTYAVGKLFHSGQNKEFELNGPGIPMPGPKEKFVHTPDDIKAMDWGPYPERDEDQPDWKIASAAIEQIKKTGRDKPFFIAAGFRLPHVPCYATQKWFDLYPEDTLQLPPVKDERAGLPDFSWKLHWKLPEPRLAWLQESKQWKPFVRAYLASTSFVDSQVGRILDALKDAGLERNTIVVLWSDHGFHMGEKGISGKNALWERTTHVPLMFAGPGVSSGGKCAQPAELLDMYPTLVELCALSPRGGLEGHSLVPQLKDAAATRVWPAITTCNKGSTAVRSERWRYIHYADGSEELYDMKSDPNEWTNLVGDAKYADVIAEHMKWLKADADLVPGSGERILEKRGEQWFWEGKAIAPGDKPSL